MPSYNDNEELKKQVKSIVSAALKRNNWSQSDLARRAGIPRNNISLYARGISVPTYKHAKKVASVLCIPIEQLVGVESTENLQNDEGRVVSTLLPNGNYMLEFQREVTPEQQITITQALKETP